jgi:hypothetical protein
MDDDSDEDRLWLDDGLTDDERLAVASSSPFDIPDLDEDWQTGFLWDGWSSDSLEWLDWAA